MKLQNNLQDNFPIFKKLIFNILIIIVFCNIISCKSYQDHFIGSWQDKDKDELNISSAGENTYTIKYSKPTGLTTTFSAIYKDSLLVAKDVKISYLKKDGTENVILDGFLSIKESNTINNTDTYTTTTTIVANASQFAKK